MFPHSPCCHTPMLPHTCDLAHSLSRTYVFCMCFSVWFALCFLCMQCCSIRGFRWIYVSGYAATCMAACMHHARMMHSMHCTQTCTYPPCKQCGCPHLHGCYAVVALHYCCVLLVLQVCRLLLGKETSAVCTVSKSVNTRA